MWGHFFTFLLLASCASYSENFVKEGELQLRGGRYQDQTWSDNLRFQRVSWYQELSLLFELLYVDADNLGEFENWLSEQEKRDIEKCPRPYLTLSYALEPRKISRADFYRQVEKKGGTRFSLSHFRKFYSTHPDMERLSLRQYEMIGLCLPDDGLSLHFPGYRPVFIN